MQFKLIPAWANSTGRRVIYALVGVVTNKLDEAFAFENQQRAKYSKCLTTTSRFIGDNTNKGVKATIKIRLWARR